MKKSCSVAVAILTLAAGGAQALTNTWTGTTDTNWNTAANWGGTALAANSGLNFTGTANTNTYNDTPADQSYANMLFGNTGNGQGFVLSGNQITLGGNITTAVTVASANITDVINFNMKMNLARKITLGTRHNLTINGVISETGTRAFSLGTTGVGGALTLTGSNSFTGVLGHDGGSSVLVISSIANSGVNSAAGAGSQIRLGNANSTAGTLEYIGGAASVDRQIQIGGGVANSTYTSGAVIKNNGTGQLRFTNQTFNVYQAGSTTANRTLTLGGNNTDSNEISGKITNNKFDGTGFSNTEGTIALVKADAGTWVLSGYNAYTATTIVSNGTLVINGDQTTAAGDVIVFAGAVLGGHGNIGGNVQFSDGAKLLFDADSTLKVASGKTVTFANFGVDDISGLSSGAASGTYTLIDGSGVNFANVTNVGAGSAYDLGGGASAYFQNSGSNLQLVVVSSGKPSLCLYIVSFINPLFYPGKIH